MILKKFTEKTINTFIENGIVPREDKDLYVYGLYQGIIILINLVSSFLVGALFNMIWQTIVFFICYIPLRTYAGGYHAKTQLRCYFVSLGILVLGLFLIRNIVFYWWISALVVLLSGSLLFFIAPVENENKPFDEVEGKKYKNVSIGIWLIESICLFIVTHYGFSELCMCIIISISIFSIMLLLGKISIKYDYKSQN